MRTIFRIPRAQWVVALSAAAAVFQVTTTSDVISASDGLTSLREAVRLANSLPGADTIRLPAGLYPIQLAGTDEDDAATGDFDVRDPLTIEGPNGADETSIDGGR